MIYIIHIIENLLNYECKFTCRKLEMNLIRETVSSQNIMDFKFLAIVLQNKSASNPPPPLQKKCSTIIQTLCL